MLAPARHGNARDFAHSAIDVHDYDLHGELYSGDRICPAPDACSGNGLLRAYLFIFAVLAGGWMLIDGHAARQIWSSAVATIAPLANYSAPADTILVPPPAQQRHSEFETTRSAVADPPPAIQPLNSREVTIAPGASDEAPASQSQTDNSNASATSTDEPTHSQQQADNNHLTPDQIRASQVGLNPDLSPVVLAQLSPADYRNADFAIRTALARIPDGGTFVWPQRRRPEAALFQVRFVTGAAQGCRRYVVTITKHRWSTTALPMEKCDSDERGSASAR